MYRLFSRFIDSEADLDAALKSLLPLAQAPVLSYAELVKSGTVALLVGLLSHENADIAIDVVEVVHELTDEDVGNEADEDDQDTADALKTLIEALVSTPIPTSTYEFSIPAAGELYIRAARRESQTLQRAGRVRPTRGLPHSWCVHYYSSGLSTHGAAGIFENVLAFNPSLSTDLVSKTKIMNWLLSRMQAKEHEENRGYAAELLSILLQDNIPNRLKFGEEDGVETVLKVLEVSCLPSTCTKYLISLCSNIVDAILLTLTRSNLWKILSMRYVRHLTR